MSNSSKKIASVKVSAAHSNPKWAKQEREIIEKLNEAAVEFVARYCRPDGTLIWRDQWGSMDGSDDPYEAFMNLALFYSIGGNERVYELARQMWDMITWQWTQYGQIHREFDGYYDWMHHGEGMLYFYFFGLTKPESLVDRQRAQSFANMYNGKDPEAPNYDPEHKVIRSPLNGSRGPRLQVTHEDWQTHRTVLDDYLAPYEDLKSHDFANKRCHWSDDAVYAEILEKMNLRMNRGDVPLNLNATTLMTHGYMYSHDDSLKQWVTDYLNVWHDRAKANNGILPDNVGLTGKIGEYNDGKWWGGYYGWRWPHGYTTIIEPLTNASMNAVLLTGDMKHLELARSQEDFIWSLRKDVDGVTKSPMKHFDTGWDDFRMVNPRNMIYIWTTSMAEEDLARIDRMPRGFDWNEIIAPGVSGLDGKTGHATKHYIANTLSWFQYMRGEIPDYPERILDMNLTLIDNQLRKMRSKTGAPRGWDNYDPATSDIEVGLDLRVDGYQIHAWQEFNPVYFEGLAQMIFGGPMHISHGGLQHGKVRPFDGQKQRTGLPDDVAMIVEKVSATSVEMQVANISANASRNLVLQAGTFGEHNFTKVTVTQSDGKSEDVAINDKWFEIELGPNSGATLKFTLDRYVNSPTYETPWQSRNDWDAVIKGRPAANFK
jgi:hypothetical protein